MAFTTEAALRAVPENAESAQRDLLRFITCGSVDDGKSTLIGRLLYDSKLLLDDQLATLSADSGGDAEDFDFASLVDGLAAEREQGITIDVAYRYFSTPRRSFIVADTPGHEQYTRNMVTGASTADLAVILIDARKGVLTQTRRHAYLASLMGVRQLVLAVNKMDLVGYDQGVFERIVADFREFAAKVDAENITAIPISALKGENVAAPSKAMDWHRGPTLLEHLETIGIADAGKQNQPFRMAVQWVNRASQDFRGFAGQIASGAVRTGDAVRILPSGRSARIARIVTAAGDLPRAIAGQSVTLTLTEEVDCSRGDVIAADDEPVRVSDRIEATLVWMAEEKLQPGRPYWLKLGTKLVSAKVAEPKYRIDVNTLERKAAPSLALNEIGDCELSLDQRIALEPFENGSEFGGFILIDRLSNETVAAGLVRHPVESARDLHWQAIDVDPSARANIKGQRPAVLWFTGLSGAGKSTIANLVEKKLHSLGRHTILLDGDNVRHGLNRDLGFSEDDRAENIRRVAEVAKLMTDAGLIVLVSFISPFRAEREMARAAAPDGAFHEIFIDTPLALAEQRDVKGLYKKARRGELANFTGIDSPYEAPERPEIRIDTTRVSAAEAAEQIVAHLTGEGAAGNWSV